MKQLVSIICLGAFISCLTGCSKNNADPVSHSLTGSWELRQAGAGMTPEMQYQPGNGNIIQFTATGYAYYANGQLIKSGTYTVVSDPGVANETCLNIPAGQFGNRIVYDNDFSAAKLYIQVDNDTLNFLSGCFAVDAGMSKRYERQ
jgi:hypothetical protein